MRHTRAHTRNRRSHHGIEGRNLSECQNCKEKKLPHKVCLNCGQYKGKQVLNVQAKLDKKAKKAKAKENAPK